MKHCKAPLFDCLYEYSKRDIVSFDVPGHKQGLYKNRFIELMGELGAMDVNSMPELDLLSKPTSIIKEAQDLFADAYGVDNSFFLVNGTTGGILSMLGAALRSGDKVIVPRNVHKSVISALTLTGAVPIFVQPELDSEYLVMNSVESSKIMDAIKAHPDVKAVLFIIPTYFGIIGDYQSVIEFCKSRGIITLVDMAHGAHLKFLNDFDEYYKADLIAISTHKTLGSMSQSSVLLHNEGLVSYQSVLESLTLFQTTSASYLLMSSVDEVRRDIMINHQNRFEAIAKLVEQTKVKINNIEGLKCFDTSYLNDIRYKLDPFKITIKVNELGLNGFEVYKQLKSRFDIQVELAESYTILALVSIADDENTLNALVEALTVIASENKNKPKFEIDVLPTKLMKMVLTPNQAHNCKRELVKLNDSVNRVSANTIMIYPPGIPICLPGEVIDAGVVEMLDFYKDHTAFTFSGNENDCIEVIVEENYEF